MKTKLITEIFEDALDISLLVGATAYTVAISEGWIGFGEQASSAIAACGAGARFALRRLVKKIAELIASRTGSDPGEAP